MVVRFLIISFIATIAGFYIGIQEWRLSRLVQETPHAMTLKELIDQGPGDNHHIILTGFEFGDQYVYEQNKKSNSNTGKVWMPITLPEEEGHGGPIRALVKAEGLRTQADIERFTKKDKIQGVIINLIESLSGDERRLLEQAYPGTKIDSVHILEVDRHKKISSTMSFGFGMGGIGAVVFVFMLLLKVRDGGS